jgi:hypothetical protein
VAASGDLAGTVEGLARSGPDLNITANLSVTVHNIDLAISTVDDRIRIQVPSVRAGIRLIRSERDRLQSVSRVLSETGMVAEIRIGSRVVAVAGTDAAPGTVSKLLSLGPVELHPRGLVGALLGPQ